LNSYDFQDNMRAFTFLLLIFATVALGIGGLFYGGRIVIKDLSSDYRWVCSAEKPLKIEIDDRGYCIGNEELELPTRDLKTEAGGKY